MKIVILIQARMTSSRLPGKVLMDFNFSKKQKSTFLEYQIRRIQKSKDLDAQIGVVTTGLSSDDPIKQLCDDLDVYCYRGSEHDVLDRYFNAAKELKADVVVRITSDCPLVDPNIISRCINKLVQKNYDFVGSTEPLPTTFPDGMDVSVFTFSALEDSYQKGLKPSEREHVTFYITENKENYKIGKIENKVDLSEYRLCIDYPDDVEMIQKIFSHFEEDDNPYLIPMERIIEIIDKFDLKNINSSHSFGEGWQSAFEKDKKSQKVDQNQANHLDHTKTDLLWEKQVEYIPGGAQTFSKMPNAHVKGAAPKLLNRGKGGRVWDFDNNEYIDFVLGLGPIILGHCFKEVDDAYSSCASNYFTTPSLGHPLEAELAEKLSDIIPCAEMVRFGKNGSDATAGAVRLARGLTNRNIIGCCGYHGWQDWFIGQTPRNRGIPKVIGEMTIPFQYNDIKSVEKIFEENHGNVAALVMEAFGAEFPEDNFLERVKEICHKNGALLIYDEVITGFRFSLGGAQKKLGVTPDIACFGKAIANGYPLSVIAGKKEYMEQFEDVFFSFTYGGELPSIAASLKTIEVIEREGVINDILVKGERFIQGFNSAAHSLEVDYMRAFGDGSWPKYEIDERFGFTTNEILTLFQQELVRRGMLTRTTPFICYTHSHSDIENLIHACKESMAIVDKALTEKNLHNYIDGEVIQTIIRDENIKH